MDKTRLVLVAATCLMMSGCAGQFCTVAKPISVSTKDTLTRETQNQILAHDETGERLCGPSWSAPVTNNSGAATSSWLSGIFR